LPGLLERLKGVVSSPLLGEANGCGVRGGTPTTASGGVSDIADRVISRGDGQAIRVV
jgi:hypothetical protein